MKQNYSEKLILEADALTPETWLDWFERQAFDLRGRILETIKVARDVEGMPVDVACKMTYLVVEQAHLDSLESLSKLDLPLN